MTIKIAGDKITFPDDSIQTTAYDGSSGGGSYTKAEIDAQQGAQDTNISGNTTAIGTLSGQVSQNTDDISELQDSIFFTSAYTADYPSAPNRDPLDGNMYLQSRALFTYSYAEATQIFASKTDEAGNVRQFTAVKAGDSIVLNEVNSPNYGRYELVSIDEVSSSYVVMNVTPMLGQGTIITGAKVAFQAFPKPASDVLWTDVGGVATSKGSISVSGNSTLGANATASNFFADKLYLQQFLGDTNYSFFVNGDAQVELTNAFNAFVFNANTITNVSTFNHGVSATEFIGDGSKLTGLPERLCDEIYPNSYSDLSSQTYTKLDNGTLTVNVEAGKKYIVTAGSQLNVQNITGVNTYGYFKIAMSTDGGAYEDTRINMIGGAKTGDGGTGWIGALERSYIYEPTASASIQLSAYAKVSGTGAFCAFNGNTVRIQEV